LSLKNQSIWGSQENSLAMKWQKFGCGQEYLGACKPERKEEGQKECKYKGLKYL
jgi:hypothetical protein